MGRCRPLGARADESLHPDRHGRQRRPAGRPDPVCGRRSLAVHRLAEHRHRPGGHHGRHLPELPDGRGAAGFQAHWHRHAQRAPVHRARHRGAGGRLAPVDARRPGDGREGAAAHLQSLPAHGGAAGHRPHPGRGHPGPAAVADFAHESQGGGRGAALSRHGQLRARLRHDRHPGRPDQPDGRDRQRGPGRDRQTPGRGPDDDVLRHSVGQPGVQTRGRQAGAPHRAAHRAHEYGAAGHFDDVRAPQPVADARDAQLLRRAPRG
ncbi:hypothetical protein Tfont_00259 [Tepidimonas fonticaldi]|uniref:Uncharacterized protein n=1 Tax=Tepidimonas fonticaldi TaxID=1101373 RepID=A0A554XQA4_9BURK|nr:hypothetical protein Tfont_00259 [Tepidimonas fonticaldi]